ncbi:MAG: helix-turn-helix domain-containing protein [Candidatus Omnitrophota bacterium]
MERFLTPKQLCELLQVDLSTVYLWTHTEFIPHYKLGRCVRFLEVDVQAWLQKRRQSGRTTFKYTVSNLVNRGIGG